jgi:pimeloyl-ACP methyl ester carboxylesterase
MAVQRAVRRDGVRLVAHDHGGQGRPPVVLLHGLAGHSGEWDTTVEWMRERHRVIALDQRGHGASERHPTDVSRDAYVRDVVAVINALSPKQAQPGQRTDAPEHAGLEDAGLREESRGTHPPPAAPEEGDRPEPVVLVGQSLGGHTAMLVAAARPDLVRALVMVEAGPGGNDPGGVAQVERWLASWPVPFPSPTVAAEFLGGGAVGAGWAAGLEEREDGWWPRFDPALMVRSLTEDSRRSFWHEWEQIACPTLVVLAESGIITSREAGEMTRTRPGVVMARTPGAGHDVHLEAPGLLRSVLEDFLETL